MVNSCKCCNFLPGFQWKIVFTFYWDRWTEHQAGRIHEAGNVQIRKGIHYIRLGKSLDSIDNRGGRVWTEFRLLTRRIKWTPPSLRTKMPGTSQNFEKINRNWIRHENQSNWRTTEVCRIYFTIIISLNMFVLLQNY